MHSDTNKIITSDCCYLQTTCWKYQNKDNSCKDSAIFCPRLFRIDYLLEEALLSPKQKQHMTLVTDSDLTDNEQFVKLKQIQDNIESFVASGKNIYLHSTRCGNGKTAWSLRLIQSYINSIWFKSDLRCRALFLSVPRYLLSLKESITTPSPYVDHVKKNIFDADLVVFDEIGVKVATPFEHENLLNMISTRIDLGKSNIYTSNLTYSELSARMGTRLCSRIQHMSEDVELFGQDKRGINS